MQVKLMVERGQNECVVKLAGTHYKFTRNERGDLIAEVSDLQTIKWVSDPRNSSFMPYSQSKTVIETAIAKPAEMPEGELVDRQIIEEVFEEKVVFTDEPPADELPLHEQVGSAAYAPHVGQVDEVVPPEEKFICPECGKEMKSAQSLQGHMGGAHRGK